VRSSSFGELVAEGESVPVEGWDFCWFQGRATEERPRWGYSRLLAAVDDEDDLPFPPESFDLVVSRHPTVVLWKEIARVLQPGGAYLSQQVGAGSNRELTDFMMGPQSVSRARRAGSGPGQQRGRVSLDRKLVAQPEVPARASFRGPDVGNPD
jgi:SAM-dependent methyltransferase